MGGNWMRRIHVGYCPAQAMCTGICRKAKSTCRVLVQYAGRYNLPTQHSVAS